jgi:anti-sigma-K factor RskA
MNYRGNPELIERLAAEYVLGTLRGPARLRLVRLARENSAVAHAVRKWEARLTPMASALREVRPHRRVWSAIEARLSSAGAGAPRGIWSSLAFWRNLGLVASGCAAALLVAIALRQPRPTELPLRGIAGTPGARMQESYVAALSDKSGKVVLLVYAARDSDQLWLKRNGVRATNPAQQALQLWGLPKEAGAAPKSLGLIPASEKVTLKLATAADTALRDIPSLAVSLEPAGGSRTGLPTGPVIYTGPCFRLW